MRAFMSIQPLHETGAASWVLRGVTALRRPPLTSLTVRRWREIVERGMIRLTDIPGPKDYLQLPKIDRERVRLLWHDDYYDGPLSGMFLYEGVECWFQDCEWGGPDQEFYRRFLILRLSPEQHAEEQCWHDLEFPTKSGQGVNGFSVRTPPGKRTPATSAAAGCCRR